MPPYVTWVVPSGRVRLPIWPVTPAPAVAWPLVSRGGQAVAQAPVQVDDVALSPACVYRVIPFGPVRTMPKFGELAEPTTTPAPVEVPPPIALGAAVPDEHAATARTATARKARIRLRDMCDSEIYVRALHGSCARSTRMPHQRFRAVFAWARTRTEASVTISPLDRNHRGGDACGADSGPTTCPTSWAARILASSRPGDRMTRSCSRRSGGSGVRERSTSGPRTTPTARS